MTDYQQIIVNENDGLATIMFNRPDRLNAWTPVMEAEVKAALKAAGDKASVRAIILTGAGSAFCAGADMGNLEKIAGGQAYAKPTSTQDPFDQRYSYPLAIPKPVVAAINGPAAGVGFVLSLFCDFRFIAADAKLTSVFARRGLIAEHGCAWMLPRLIGTQDALDLLLSGRTVNAEEAAALRLAKMLPADDFLTQVHSRVRAMVDAASPRSIAVIKRQVYQSWMTDLAAAVALADGEQALSLLSEDFKEGVAHFVERRSPSFTGR